MADMTGRDVPLAEWKRGLRAQIAALRDGLSFSQRSERSSLVCNYASEWLQQTDNSSLLAYVPFRSELDSRALIAEAWADGREVLLPRVIPGTGMMNIHRVGSWEELSPGAYGIYEPDTSSSVPWTAGENSFPDVVFVPGLAFDLRGGRLGYGQGYYDRLRASWEKDPAYAAKPPLWIGLAYGLQVVPEVPRDAHDALMDMLITENGLFHCREGTIHEVNPFQ